MIETTHQHVALNLGIETLQETSSKERRATSQLPRCIGMTESVTAIYRGLNDSNRVLGHIIVSLPRLQIYYQVHQ